MDVRRFVAGVLVRNIFRSNESLLLFVAGGLLLPIKDYPKDSRVVAPERCAGRSVKESVRTGFYLNRWICPFGNITPSDSECVVIEIRIT